MPSPVSELLARDLGRVSLGSAMQVNRGNPRAKRRTGSPPHSDTGSSDNEDSQNSAADSAVQANQLDCVGCAI